MDIEDLKRNYRGRVVLSEPLEKYTSFRIGGPADYFLEPLDKNDVGNLLAYFRTHDVPFIVIGAGSNFLVSDQGIRCAVVSLGYALNRIWTEGDTVVAEAGVRMAKFVDFCIQQGRQGVEMLAGIPGTIGGAVVMNAGAYGGEISDHLKEVEVYRDGKVLKVEKADAGFGYRQSRFAKDVVLSASFALPTGNKPELMKKRRELLVKRNQSQPLNLPNSGSIFKNPPGLFAGKLVEQAGLKGTRKGKAQISEKHGNFIVNTGGATADDVLELIRLARTTVQKKIGVTLEPEVKLLGFPDSIRKEFCN